VKEQLAACNLAVSKKGEATGPVATWEQVRMCMMAILECTEGGSIAISNIKKLFTDRFGYELSETALGYSRFSDLLHDPRLSDICRVECQGSACVVASTRPHDMRRDRMPQPDWTQVAAYDEMAWAPADEAAAMMAACEEMAMLEWQQKNYEWERKILEEYAHSSAAFCDEMLGGTVGAEHAVCPPPGLDVPVGAPPGLEPPLGLEAPRQLLPPPGIHCPYMLSMPTPVESWMEPEAWKSGAALAPGSPMKVLAVDVASPEKKAKGFRHRRSSSASTNIDSEDDVAVDSDSGAQEHATCPDDASMVFSYCPQQGPAFVAAAR